MSAYRGELDCRAGTNSTPMVKLSHCSSVMGETSARQTSFAVGGKALRICPSRWCQVTRVHGGVSNNLVQVHRGAGRRTGCGPQSVPQLAAIHW
jgi:hypothetical protein